MTALQVQLAYEDSNFRLRFETQIAARGVTALVGPSGSGKTTVLDGIAGLRPQLQEARISLGDELWQDAAFCLTPWRRPLAYVFQDARLFPHLDVRGNLEYAKNRAIADSFEMDSVIEWLAIGDYLERRPESLSAGQQQRVAIARALLRGPQLMLLDEPLANLDRVAAAQCLDCLRRIAAETQLPMLYVSHQIEEVGAIADELIIMRNGHIEAQGPTLEILGRLDTEIATLDNAAALLLAAVESVDEHYGLAKLAVDGQTLWVQAAGQPGARRRVRVPARDVSICREKPQKSSILNVLQVSLVEMRDLHPAHCLLRLQLHEQHLLARITRRSRDELSLAEGDQLFAQIKSTALLGDAGS